MSNELTPKRHADYGGTISIITYARENAFRAVNREVISMSHICKAPHNGGQFEFYREVLDSDVRKANESPSVDFILCADKDDTVVEYVFRRSLPPALMANYQLHLPNQKLLENKLPRGKTTGY
jgi:hypothetical protein